MAKTDEIALFVRESLARQIPRVEVEAALLSAGWRPEQVRKALAGYADMTFPVPVPRPTTHVSAGEAFLYLVLFAALGMSAHAVVELLFKAIEWLYPDPAERAYAIRYWEAGLRWAVARAIIAFPVFLLASRAAARLYRSDPTQRSSPVRRWLTYAAMFIAACVIIGDFVTLIAYLLGGELTTRFLLKVAVVAIVAGVILGYYLRDLRSDEGSRPAAANALLAAATLVTAAAIGIGLLLLGLPSERYARRLDERRVADLREIAQAVDLHLERQGSMPASLAELGDVLGTRVPTSDPATSAPYEYSLTGERGYTLCATFERRSEGVTDDGRWTHAAGPQCFTLTAGDEQSRR